MKVELKQFKSKGKTFLFILLENLFERSPFKLFLKVKPATIQIGSNRQDNNLSVKSGNLKWKTQMTEKKTQQEKPGTERQKEVFTSKIRDKKSKIEEIKKSCGTVDRECLGCIVQAEKKNDMYLI